MYAREENEEKREKIIHGNNFYKKKIGIKTFLLSNVKISLLHFLKKQNRNIVKLSQQ